MELSDAPAIAIMLDTFTLSAHPIAFIFSIMGDAIFLADARIQILINHWLAQHPELYKIALILTNRGTDVAVFATLLWLWFWPDPKRRLFFEADLDEEKNTGLARVLTRPVTKVREAAAVNVNPILWRIESRAQLLTLAVALAAGYITSRLIGIEVGAARPFATFLPIREGEPGQFLAIRREGSFPSNHAVLLGALPFFFYWHSWLGWVWTIFTLALIVIRSAVGFHSPLDMATGAALGLIYVGVLMRLYFRGGRVYRWAQRLAGQFELTNVPYCYYFYFLAGLTAYEVFAKHCDHIMEVIFMLRGSFLAKFQ